MRRADVPGCGSAASQSRSVNSRGSSGTGGCGAFAFEQGEEALLSHPDVAAQAVDELRQVVLGAVEVMRVQRVHRLVAHRAGPLGSHKAVP